MGALFMEGTLVPVCARRIGRVLTPAGGRGWSESAIPNQATVVF